MRKEGVANRSLGRGLPFAVIPEAARGSAVREPEGVVEGDQAAGREFPQKQRIASRVTCLKYFELVWRGPKTAPVCLGRDESESVPSLPRHLAKRRWSKAKDGGSGRHAEES